MSWSVLGTSGGPGAVSFFFGFQWDLKAIYEAPFVSRPRQFQSAAILSDGQLDLIMTQLLGQVRAQCVVDLVPGLQYRALIRDRPMLAVAS